MPDKSEAVSEAAAVDQARTDTEVVTAVPGSKPFAQEIDWTDRFSRTRQHRQLAQSEPSRPASTDQRQVYTSHLGVPTAKAANEARERQAQVRLGAGSLDGVSSQGLTASSSAFAPPSSDRLRKQADVARRQSAAAMPHDLSRERFPQAIGGTVNKVASAPVSTYSIDVDTASYSFVRNNLVNGARPHPQAVRPEELINYFSYDYPLPDSPEVPFSTNVSMIDTPWNADTKLLQIGLQGYKIPLADLPPQHLVFLIDTSGSMNRPDKLPLLKQAFRLLLATLREEDTIAIVTYAGHARVALEPTPASDKISIADAVNSLWPGGGTAGHAGLQEAYALADSMRENGGNARILLATDGDFNVGLSSVSALKDYIKNQSNNGIGLSVLGFGRGNYNDALMQTLAQNGNGFAAYIDTLAEARKVLVESVVGSLMTIASDVKIQVEFNPATIAEYRLIGYETRALQREDFNNDKVDAGDIGAGHTVTALYEVTPVGSPAMRLDDLRYQVSETIPATAVSDEFADEVAFVKLRYKLPGETKSRLISTPVKFSTSEIPESETLFAAAVAGFAQHLQGSSYLGAWTLGEMAEMARTHAGDDRLGYRAEFLSLLQLADFAEN
ncbi:von Willebrand factor type A domain-containing protein [Roseibium sp. HPY-6]|uniref:vWA domain-containing protein n=1 Tax=Roseibium sp. HPY-6 TaxID=3229852 RepID=UPI00338FB8A1